MSRWRAAGTHLAISAIVALIVFGVLFTVWYPGPLFESMGGEKLIYLIVGIDVVAGPLLTLIVFKSGKKGLKLDLTLIGLAQLAFLIYGLGIATTARPAYVVFNVDRFSVVPANALRDEDLAAGSSPEFRRRPYGGPLYVVALQPQDNAEQQALVTSALEGRDIEFFPKYYRPYAEHKDVVIAAARPLGELDKLGDATKAAVERFLATREDDEDLLYLPLNAKYKNHSAIVSRTSGQVVEMLRIDPWDGTVHE